MYRKFFIIVFIDKTCVCILFNIYVFTILSHKIVLNLIIPFVIANKVTIFITDVAGKVLVQKLVNVIAGDNGIQLDVSKLASGTYVMKAICENGCDSGSKKFMKQ